MLLFMVLAIKMMFTLTHCRHLDLAVNGVRDEPAKGKMKIFMLEMSKTKDQSESDFDVGVVRFEPGRLVVVILHPLAHADEAGLLIRGLPRSARFHFHD